QPAPHRAATAAPAARFQLGSGRPCFSGGNGMKAGDIDVSGDVRVSVRSCTPADEEHWERFVERCPDASFFHRIGWRTVLEEVFRHRTHYLLAEREAELIGVLPLAEVRSRLFGHALTSLPFGVYGG